MFRALLRLVVVLVDSGRGGGVLPRLVGRRPLGPGDAAGGRRSARPGRIDTEKAQGGRRRGRREDRRGGQQGREVLSDGALTAKIKSKMALDDLVKARTIDVTTTNHVVTLSGTVGSVGEHDRAVQLAKETAGVTQVVDTAGAVTQR